MSAIEAQPVGTGRLILLPLRPEHADEMAVVLGDPALHAFIGGTPLGPRDLRARYEWPGEGGADQVAAGRP
jgi:hypothetical protein